jgi:transcription factor SPT20
VFAVKTSDYILKKFRGHPPSLVLHLHPTHFRFQNQDGSFRYNSPMKVILEYIRARTVPHDMMEEFATAGVNFYEGMHSLAMLCVKAKKTKDA